MSTRKTTNSAANHRSKRVLSPPKSASISDIQRAADPIAAQADQYAAIADARNKFIAVTIGMGWRMAITFLVPVVIGVKLDTHFKTTPSYTITALFLGIFISAVVIRDTMRDITAQQAADTAATGKGNKREKTDD